MDEPLERGRARMLGSVRDAMPLRMPAARSAQAADSVEAAIARNPPNDQLRRKTVVSSEQNLLDEPCADARRRYIERRSPLESFFGSRKPVRCFPFVAKNNRSQRQQARKPLGTIRLIGRQPLLPFNAMLVRAPLDDVLKDDAFRQAACEEFLDDANVQAASHDIRKLQRIANDAVHTKHFRRLPQPRAC